MRVLGSDGISLLCPHPNIRLLNLTVLYQRRATNPGRLFKEKTNKVRREREESER